MAADSVSPSQHRLRGRACPRAEHEQPEDWGWHHEFRAGRQIGGWLSFLILAVLLTTTHYNQAGSLAILLTMSRWPAA